MGTTSDGAGNNVLHHAMSCNFETVKQILHRSGDRAVDLCKAKNKDGQTPLHCLMASRLGVFGLYPTFPVAAVKLLVTAGRDVNAVDNDGNTPLAVFLASPRSYRKLATCQYLLPLTRSDQLNREGLTLGHTYTRYYGGMDVRILQALTEAGVNLSAVDYRDRTMLHHIAFNGWLTEDVMGFLLTRAELRLDTPDADGITPLQSIYATAPKQQHINQFEARRWGKTLEIFMKYEQGDTTLRVAGGQEQDGAVFEASDHIGTPPDQPGNNSDISQS